MFKKRFEKKHLEVRFADDAVPNTVYNEFVPPKHTAVDIVLVTQTVAKYGAAAYVAVKTTDTLLRLAEHILVKRVA